MGWRSRALGDQYDGLTWLSLSLFEPIYVGEAPQRSLPFRCMSRLQHVFRLPDPHTFPALDIEWTHDELEMLRPYVTHAETLARTTLLSAESGLRRAWNAAA